MALRSSSFALVLGLSLAACGGKVGPGSSPGGSGGSSSDAGTGSSLDGSSGMFDASGRTSDSGQTGLQDAVTTVPPDCVDIDAASYGRTCKQSADCNLITAGNICSGACDCGGNTAVNASGLAAFESAISSIKLAECPCAEPEPPACVKGVCTPCGTPSDPLECGELGGDGGPPPPVDSGAPPQVDGGPCIDIVATSLPTACMQNTDCVEVASGEICPGLCNCVGTSVNMQGAAEAAKQLASVPPGECTCPFFGMAACIQGQCSLCGPGLQACPAM